MRGGHDEDGNAVFETRRTSALIHMADVLPASITASTIT
jgi:hypothetical protein